MATDVAHERGTTQPPIAHRLPWDVVGRDRATGGSRAVWRVARPGVLCRESWLQALDHVRGRRRCRRPPAHEHPLPSPDLTHPLAQPSRAPSLGHLARPFTVEHSSPTYRPIGGRRLRSVASLSTRRHQHRHGRADSGPSATGRSADRCDTGTEFSVARAHGALLGVDGCRDKPFNGSHGAASAEDLRRLP